MLALRRTLTVLGALLAVAIVAAAVLAFVTFGLGQSNPPTRAAPAPAASAVASSTTSPDAPASFTDRPPFRSCGQVELGQGATIPPTRIACLAATSAEGRELVVVSVASDGARIVRYFRTGPEITGVELFEDATADPADGSWHHSFCRSGQIDQFGACA
jgi:hypothetical protein